MSLHNVSTLLIKLRCIIFADGRFHVSYPKILLPCSSYDSCFLFSVPFLVSSDVTSSFCSFVFLMAGLNSFLSCIDKGFWDFNLLREAGRGD